jgi:hypothetical protein
MCDSILSLITSLVSQPLTRCFKQIFRTSYLAGRNLSPEDFHYLTEKHFDPSGGSYYASPDWSKYDNHIYEELMVVACGILQQCFLNSEKESYY